MSPNPQQFTKYPMDIKTWRRHLSATKWTVLAVIHEKLADWNKESDAVSNSQIAAETTLSESSIRRAIAEMNTTDGPLEVITLGTRGIPVFRVRPCDRCQSDRCQSDTPPTTTTTGVNLTPIAPLDRCQSDTPVNLTGVNLTPTTDVTNSYLRESLKDSLSIDSEQGAETAVEENGRVVETEGKVDLAPVVLGDHLHDGCLFRNLKTDKTWEFGQELSCLSYEAKITMGEAEAILSDGNGMSVANILAILKKNWKRINKSSNKAAYMRTIIQNQAPGRKANAPAEPTSKPLPRSAAPLPFAEEQAPAKLADDDIIDLGSLGTAAGNWGDWDDGDDTAPVADPGVGLFDDDEAPAIEPAAVEEPASPALAPEASQDPVAQKAVMPSGLVTWEAVVWNIHHGVNDTKVMAAEILVGVDTIERNRNLAVSKGALVRRMEGATAIYTIAPGWRVPGPAQQEAM